MKKKFTRKRPIKTVRPVAVTQHEFVKPYTHEYYYAKHFGLWRAWHAELLASTDRNAKRQKRSLDEAIGHLDSMTRYLDEETASRLRVEIDRLRRIARDVAERGEVLGTTRVELERSQRTITAHFYTEKVRDHILPDRVDLGSPV